MHRKLTAAHLLIFASLVSRTCCLDTAAFSRQWVRMCLKPSFVFNVTMPHPTELTCASVCKTRGPRCQGFLLTDSVCQTLEFDRCSHAVNQAGCSESAWVFVRSQDGLPPGQLCPDGFSSGRLGSTYKMIDVSSWTQGLSYCSSLPGLAKFADGFDKPEVDYFHSLKSTLNGDLVDSMWSFYVGGFRTGNRTAGTWFWHTCNATFLPEVWEHGQPNGADDMSFRGDIWYSHTAGIDDELEICSDISRALCECVNPFV